MDTIKYHTWPRTGYFEKRQKHKKTSQRSSALSQQVSPSKLLICFFQDINLKFQTKCEILTSQPEKQAMNQCFRDMKLKFQSINLFL